MSSAENKDAPVKPKLATQARNVHKGGKEEKPKKCCWKAYFLSDICIQVTAWLLLTAGLCIIACTIYVGILMENNRGKCADFNQTHEFDYVTEHTGAYEEPTTENLNKSVRSLALPILDVAEDRNGCRVINCKVSCMDAFYFYEMLYKATTAATCTTFDAVLIREQSFVNGVLDNFWIDCNRPIYELVISESNVTCIKSGAFNSPLFVDTYLLTLSGLQLTKVGSGTLLGLRSLRYLIIDTPLTDINRAFFQPVQSTLMHLRMNCGLTILPNAIFGVSTLEKLEYADLSKNFFYGPLTRQMFRATPNLRYLHMTQSRVTAIEADAFDDLSGELEVLDLSENLIKTISSTVLKPLLLGSKRTLISLAHNKWNCVCELLELAKLYRKYRKSFLSSIFCQSPELQHGKPLNELISKDGNCMLKNISETYESLVTTIHNRVTSTRTKTTRPSATTNRTISTTTMHQTTHTTISPTTTQKHSTSTVKCNTTIATSNVSNNAIESDGSSSRSSAEDLNTIQLRCLHILRSGNQREVVSNTAVSKRSKAAFASDSKSLSELNQTETSEDIVENSVELEQSLTVAPTVTQYLSKTTSEVVGITNITKLRSKREYHNPSMAYYKFEVPTYNFKLTLLANNSVQVLINDYTGQPKINMIWFSRQNEVASIENDDEAAQNIDYHCEMYQRPYLLVSKLSENTTYTFCMLEIPQTTISPFNCLPLYVPSSIMEPDNTWITQEDKQFTLGMLSLIFTLSALFGGIIAYFGIKTYPELLEGSKNVLVVKRSEQESEYLQSMGSIKKEPLSRRSTTKHILAASEMPPLSLPPPPPFSVSNYNLERLSSIKSSSTLFESSFCPPPFSVLDDQYELPKQYSRNVEEERCVPNPYAMSPCSPPPLPKRNPSITSSIATNRFAKIK
ncbi:PREDICTED: uncharacterized protein LOC108978205 [Bactrocera latifrons]|uniref:uncharacterized protein LOC108978205 n=1 Tax=Bactrocera latifrons TaxID=174628 RepID=UPI0008DD1DBA|nr:PREDICTED: uncharacterized protein LOC108978205 [Bactrocera latifrons]